MSTQRGQSVLIAVVAWHRHPATLLNAEAINYGLHRRPGKEAEGEKKVLNYFLMHSVALSESVRVRDGQEMDAGREAAGRCGLAVLLMLSSTAADAVLKPLHSSSFSH